MTIKVERREFLAVWNVLLLILFFESVFFDVPRAIYRLLLLNK